MNLIDDLGIKGLRLWRVSMHSFLQDLRFAIRILVKTPGLAMAIILTLAVAIGANSAIFSIANAVLLRPLPYPEPDRLVEIRKDWKPFWAPNGELSPYLDTSETSAWKEQNQVLSQMAVFGFHESTLTGSAVAELINSAHVSSSFLSTFGAVPQLGRAFLPDESRAGGQVAILSNGIWRRHFGGDTNVLGQTIKLDGESYTVIGVLSPSFDFIQNVDVMVPLNPTKRLPVILYHAIGRLKPGVSIDKARADLDRIYQATRDPKVIGRVALVGLREALMGNSKRNVLIYLGGTGFVLLIACANIANLLLARGTHRQKEMGIRVALGAGSHRIMRQLLTENLLLALLGGTGGLVLGWWAKGSLEPLIGTLPRFQPVRVDFRVLAFTLVLTLLTALIFGAFPAFMASRLSPGDAIRDGTRSGGTGGVRQRHMSGFLVISEVTLALVLLLGSGLLLKTFVKLQGVNLGFNPDRILSLRIDLSEQKYAGGPKQAAYFEQIVERLRALPGVEAVAIDAALPLSGYSIGMMQSRDDGKAPQIISAGIVNADYFRTMGIPLKKGRLFTDEDRAGMPKVALVNESFARSHFAGEDPLGKQVHDATVVGVVGDVRQVGPAGPPDPLAYFCYLQNGYRSMSLAVRTKGNPLLLAGAIRAQIVDLDKDQPIHGLTTLQQSLSERLTSQRANMLLSGALGLLAIGLVAVGIYGVLSFSVAQRTHDIGVRMAMGARRADVLKLVIAEGLKLTTAGIALGLMAGFCLTRFLSSLLWGVGALDVLTFTAVSLFLTVIGVLACYLPAKKAARLDPMVALRCE